MKKIVSALVALMMVACLSVTAFAAVSPSAPIHKDYDGGTATFEKDTNSGAIILTAKNRKGYKFLKWEINGNYEIVSGSLDSKTITIKFVSADSEVQLKDVDATPKFEKVPGAATKPTKGDDDKVSPGTSDNGLGVMALAVLALGGVVISKKKLAK